MNTIFQPTEWISDILGVAMVVSPREMEILESMTGCSSPGELSLALADPTWEEAGTVQELLVFPDQESRERVEALLEQNALTQGEERDLIKAVQDADLMMSLAFPEISVPVRFVLAPDIVAAYVKRFCLTRSIPPGLVKALGEMHDVSRVQTAFALLRASGIAWTWDLEDMAARILEKNHAREDFISIFEKALILLKEVPADRHPEEYIEEKRDWCLYHLERGRAEEKELAGKNMETLLLSGVRTSYVDAHRLEDQLALIDRILYGMPPLPGF